MSEQNSQVEAPLAIQEARSSNSARSKVCDNCETPLTGPFCHQCGQPSKSIIRFFGSLIAELFDDIIRLDSRALRSLSALMLKPGFLTNEFIRGRRFHYVSPIRLFLFSSILCFFVLWVVNLASDADAITVDDADKASAWQLPDNTRSALFKDKPDLQGKLKNREYSELSEQEQALVIERIRQANKQLESIGMPIITLPPNVEALDSSNNAKSHEKMPSDSDQALLPTSSQENLVEVEPAATNSELGDVAKEAKDSNNENDISEREGANNVISGTAVKKAESRSKKDEETNVNIKVSWLKEKEKEYLEKKLKNWVEKIKADPKDFISDMLELIPKTMLFLLPLFALLMRACYPFSKRFYIEHAIHAIHGHAFLFLSIMILVIFELIGDGLANSESLILSAISAIAKTLEVLTFIWIPIYFLLSLRNVYRQMWLLTIFKWILLSVLYCILFATGTAAVVLTSALIN